MGPVESDLRDACERHAPNWGLVWFTLDTLARLVVGAAMGRLSVQFGLHTDTSLPEVAALFPDLLSEAIEAAEALGL